MFQADWNMDVQYYESGIIFTCYSFHCDIAEEMDSKFAADVG